MQIRAQISKDSELLKKVISDCFSNKYLNEKSDSLKSIVLIDKTLWHASGVKGEPYKDFINKDFNLLDSSTYSDFLNKNEYSQSIDSVKLLKQNIIYISDSVWINIFKNGGWKKFYKCFPNSLGFVEFSSIGFNSNKTQALIYYRQMSDFSYGNGFYLLYNLENGNWYKKQSKLGWTSK
jgi:hypothetical protein